MHRIGTMVFASVLFACGGSTSSPSSSTSPSSPQQEESSRSTNDTADTSGTSTLGPGSGAPESCMPSGTKSGDACTDDGRSCSAVEWCDSSAGALVTDDHALACAGGTWTEKGGSCPAAGEVNADGCPLMQPEGGTSCTVDGSKCHYGRECILDSCNGAPNCVEPKKALHGYSECNAGTWTTTTALAACP